MNILFIGWSPIEFPGNDSMESHVVSALGSLGIDCTYFPMLGKTGFGRRVSRFIELAMTDLHWIGTTPVERRLLAKAEEVRPDMVLVLLGNYTTPSTIRKLKQITGAPVVCWCQDHMGTLGRQYVIGSKFDYLFAKDQVMVDRFRQFTGLGEVHYMAEACNPAVHKPVKPTAEDERRFGCDVTTAATLYYYRSEILESLKDFDLKIWGPVPRFYDGDLRKYATGESVYMRDKAACFNASSIVVNSLFPMEVGGLNARAFEVAGCGGFQLISETDAVARHFEPGKEIETFSNLGELREKVIYYLENESKRKSIAEAGQARAHAEHTYEHRLAAMFGIMGFSLPVTAAPEA